MQEGPQLQQSPTRTCKRDEELDVQMAFEMCPTEMEGELNNKCSASQI